MIEFKFSISFFNASLLFWYVYAILRTKYGIENVTSDLIENLLDNKYYSIVNIYEFETGRPLDIFNPSILTDNDFLNALNIVYHKNIID